MHSNISWISIIVPNTGLRIRDRAMNEKPQERVFLGRGTGRQ